MGTPPIESSSVHEVCWLPFPRSRYRCPVDVTDPIFDSLWEATLSELQNDTALWEVYADTPNFYARGPAEVRAAAAESVLRRLRDEGWASFVWRPSNLPDHSPGRALSDDEVERVLAVARQFYSVGDAASSVPQELEVRLSPNQKWVDWAGTAYG